MQKLPGDIILLHMCTINEDHIMMLPEIWSATDRIFLTFWTSFCHFTSQPPLPPPPKNPENQNFEKMEKIPGDIIFLHKCIINNNDMMYGS